MPWRVEKMDSCPADRPWAVVKETDGSVEGCHPSKAAAQKQQAALYASEAGKGRGGVEYVIEDERLACRWGEDGEEFAYEDEDGMEAAFCKAVAAGLAAGETWRMAPFERDVARALGERVGVVKEAGSLFLAWWPDPELAAQLAAISPGGSVAQEDIHLTLLYLGDPYLPGAELDVDLVLAVTKVFTTHFGCVDAVVAGLGRFVASQDQDAVVALVDSPRISRLRECLKDDLLVHSAIPYGSPVLDEQHGFMPHITLDYVPKSNTTQRTLAEPIEFSIDNVCAVLPEGTRVKFMIKDAEVESEHAQAVPMAMGKAFNMGRALGPDQTWDVADAEGRVREKTGATDAPNAAYAACFLYQGGDGTKYGDYKFLVTDVVDGKLMIMPRALRAAASRLPGSSIPAADKKRIRAALDTLMEKMHETEKSIDLVYAVAKASEEKRYTLGPLYAPDRLDAHKEWVAGETLQEAVWEYVRESAGNGRLLNLQHKLLGDVQVGEWVECMAWPYEHTIKVTVPGGEERELTMPAGTIYMGVIWNEESWPLVKAGKLTGLSLGGKAVRVATPDADLPHMGDKLAAQHGKMHAYVEDEKKDVCDTCGMTRAEGDHFPEKDTESKKVREEHDRQVGVLLAAAASEEQRHREEVAALKAAVSDDRGLVQRLIDVFSKQAERDLPETHIHLPEQNVIIQEAPVQIEYQHPEE